MNTAAELLSKLATLSEVDRSWVLGKLPPGAKRKLLQSAETDVADPAPQNESAPPASDSADAVVGAISRATADTMRQALRNEPDWFVVAVLRAHEWPWRVEFLALLPAPVRWEIERHVDACPALTNEMRSSVLAATAAQLDVHSPASTVTRFEALVQRLSAYRSRRRWMRAL
jgi:hypothetical protein